MKKKKCNVCDDTGYFTNPFDQTYPCKCKKKTKKKLTPNTLTKQEVFNIIHKALVKSGFVTLGGGKVMTLFKEPYSKLFFNIHGDLVLRKLEHWDDYFEEKKGVKK